MSKFDDEMLLCLLGGVKIIPSPYVEYDIIIVNEDRYNKAFGKKDKDGENENSD